MIYFLIDYNNSWTIRLIVDFETGMQVVKEESENSTSGSRSMEPTTFVNVALSCNEAGPSGLQQQKLGEISEMGIQQSSEGDTKTG